MTHENEGHYAAKHSPETKLDPSVAGAIKAKVKDGKISCAVAFKIARKLNITPAEVGVALDLMEVRISRCQLGLFGYTPEEMSLEPAESVSTDLEDAIRNVLVNDRLPCDASWEIADTFGIPKMHVSAACDALNIKISACQLGSFT